MRSLRARGWKSTIDPCFRKKNPLGTVVFRICRTHNGARGDTQVWSSRFAFVVDYTASIYSMFHCFAFLLLAI